MKEIKKNGPVQMIFRVYSDFFMYKTGIYSRHPKAITLNDDISYHSISVYGWNFSTNGVPYWVYFEIKVILFFFYYVFLYIKYAHGSWGINWGEQGYFKIRMNDVDTEIGQHVYGAYATYS